MRRVNLEHDPPRAITDETAAFGLALYEGPVEDGKFKGGIVGNITDPLRAERWLLGDDVKLDVVAAKPGESWV